MTNLCPNRLKLIFVLLLNACNETHNNGSADTPEPADPVPADPGEFLRGIEEEFEDAADEFDVPISVLKAVAYVATQWQMVAGEAEFEDQPLAFGVMALQDQQLRQGSQLLGIAEDDVKHDREANIRAAAALLSSLADELQLDRPDIGAWAPAIAVLCNIEYEEARRNYIHEEVYALIREGIEIRDLEGNVISTISPMPDVVADYPLPQQARSDLAVVWRPSPHFRDRPAGERGKIQMIVIHTCEGSYSGCWGTFMKPYRNKKGEWVKVSAHYVINRDGTEVSEVVADEKRASHIRVAYDPSLNGGRLSNLAGVSCNDFTIGIEHAGFASQTWWDTGLINTSASYVCSIAQNHDIPRDRYHIVGHGQLQPYDRTDPGAGWPWATYFQKIEDACSCVPSEVCTCVPLTDDSCLPGDPRL